MKDINIEHEGRGKVLEVILITQYPDSHVEVGRLSGDGLKSIIFDHDAVIDHVGKSAHVLSQWNSGDWKKNPSVLVTAKANRWQFCGWYCANGGHNAATHVSELEPVKHDENVSEADAIKYRIAELEKKLKELEG